MRTFGFFVIMRSLIATGCLLKKNSPGITEDPPNNAEDPAGKSPKAPRSDNASKGPRSALFESLSESCLTEINNYRQKAGMPLLTRKKDQESSADAEMAKDAAPLLAGVGHASFPLCEELAQNQALHSGNTDPAKYLQTNLANMYNEGPAGGHYRNMLNAKYTQVAYGFYLKGGGEPYLFSVQNFY